MRHVCKGSHVLVSERLSCDLSQEYNSNRPSCFAIRCGLLPVSPLSSLHMMATTFSCRGSEHNRGTTLFSADSPVPLPFVLLSYLLDPLGSTIDQNSPLQMPTNASVATTFMAAPSSSRTQPIAPQRLPRPKSRMINPSFLRLQPHASSAIVHPGSMADRSDSTECLFFSNIDHDLDICKSCAATMSYNIRRCLPPFEAVRSFNQCNRSRPAAAQRISSIFCDVCGVVCGGHAPPGETKISVAAALQATSLAGQPEAIALACRLFPWPPELARDGNRQQRVAMALARAGPSTSAAEQLAQRLMNDDEIAT